MDSIKQGANYVSETVQKATQGTSKEANKEVAKDNNVNVGTRYDNPFPINPSWLKPSLTPS